MRFGLFRILRLSLTLPLVGVRCSVFKKMDFAERWFWQNMIREGHRPHKMRRPNRGYGRMGACGKYLKIGHAAVIVHELIGL